MLREPGPTGPDRGPRLSPNLQFQSIAAHSTLVSVEIVSAGREYYVSEKVHTQICDVLFCFF